MTEKLSNKILSKYQFKKKAVIIKFQFSLNDILGNQSTQFLIYELFSTKFRHGIQERLQQERLQIDL